MICCLRPELCLPHLLTYVSDSVLVLALFTTAAYLKPIPILFDFGYSLPPLTPLQSCS